MRKPVYLILLLAFVGLLLAGCGGGGGGGGGGPTLLALQLSIPSNTQFATNTTVPITALATYTNGTQAFVSPTWAATPGSISAGGVYSSGGSPGTGSISATFQGFISSVVIDVVAPGTLTTPQVIPPENVSTGAMKIGDKATFYLTASNTAFGGQTLIVSPDSGTWSATGGVGAIDQNGVFTATANGNGTVGAKLAGANAAPANVAVIGQPVTVSGLVYEPVFAGGVNNVTVIFLDANGTQVGSLKTGSNGRFQGKIAPTATHMFIPTISLNYYNVFRYSGTYYWVGTPEPDPCRAPIPTPFDGLDLGTIYVYAIGQSPPPPPPGC